MVDSGIKCCNSCTPIFADLDSKKLEYVICQINDKQKVAVIDQSQAGETDKLYADQSITPAAHTPALWDRFSKKLMQLDQAFGICFVDYVTKDGRDQKKLVFVFWCSNNAKVKNKMTYSSTKMSCAKKMQTIDCQLQCDTPDDLDFKEVITKVSKNNCKF
jgi:hypothetical protein